VEQGSWQVWGRIKYILCMYEYLRYNDDPCLDDEYVHLQYTYIQTYIHTYILTVLRIKTVHTLYISIAFLNILQTFYHRKHNRKKQRA
jgi:hypothetical protein